MRKKRIGGTVPLAVIWLITAYMPDSIPFIDEIGSPYFCYGMVRKVK